MNRPLARDVLWIRRLIPLLLLSGVLSSCGTIGWETKVSLRQTNHLPAGGVVAVVKRIKGVTVVSPPPKQPPQDNDFEGLQVKRGDVVAIVMFPTPVGLKQKASSIIVATQSQSAGGKAFVKDLADALHKKYGDTARPRADVKAVRGGGPYGTPASS